MKTIALLFCLIGGWPVLSAQPSCYEKIRGDGLRFVQQEKYGEAITQFWTALTTCPDLPKNHDLDQLIQRAQATWVAELKATAQKAIEATEARRSYTSRTACIRVALTSRSSGTLGRKQCVGVA